MLVHAVVLACAVLASAAPRLPNIGYVGHGYDLVKGNPRAVNSDDPGFLFLENIYELTYYTNTTTGDGNFQIPDNTTANRVDQCSIEMSLNYVYGMTSYYEALKNTITMDSSAGWSGVGGAFKLSTEYSWMQNQTSTYSAVTTMTVADCAVYYASINSVLPPQLSANFRAAVGLLPAAYNASTYFAFIQMFGTHVMSGVLMGGRYGQQSTFTNTSWSLLQSSGLDVASSASASAILASAAGSTLTKQQQASAQQFMAYAYNQALSYTGGAFPSDGQATTWTTTVMADPMPVQYQLELIASLLTAGNFPGDAAIGAKQANLQASLRSYCQMYVALGELASCTQAPDPPRPPVMQFGGLYSATAKIVNPFTGNYSCPAGGLSAVNVGAVYNCEALPEPMRGVCETMPLFACLNLPVNLGAAIALGYGGQYTTGLGGAPNPFTGSTTCPAGTQTLAIAGTIAGAWNGGIVWVCWAFTPTTLFGGWYSTVADGSCYGGVYNPVTSYYSCPTGYKPYKVMESTSFGSCSATLTTYVCLSGI